MRTMVVNIHSVKLGKNENWLVFEAFAGVCDMNRKYKIEFCGTEILTALPLLDDMSESLKEQLTRDFGFGPYNIKEAKRILGKSKSYSV